MSYKDGIFAALVALDKNHGGGGKGSVSYSQASIKTTMQDYDSNPTKECWKFKNQWKNNLFLAALKKGVSDGDFIRTKNSFRLSAAGKKKCNKAAEKAIKKKEAQFKKKQKDTSESDTRECSDLMMEYLDHDDNCAHAEKVTYSIKKETILGALSSRLKALPPDRKMLAAPMVDGHGSEPLKGQDLRFRDAIITATNGSWVVYAVDFKRKEWYEGNPITGKNYANGNDGGTIEYVYGFDDTTTGKPLATSRKVLDGIRIPWCDLDDGGIIGCYKDTEDVWQTDSDDDWEKTDDGDPDGYDGPEPEHYGIYERTVTGMFVIGISKDLLLLPKNRAS